MGKIILKKQVGKLQEKNDFLYLKNLPITGMNQLLKIPDICYVLSSFLTVSECNLLQLGIYTGFRVPIEGDLNISEETKIIVNLRKKHTKKRRRSQPESEMVLDLVKNPISRELNSCPFGSNSIYKITSLPIDKNVFTLRLNRDISMLNLLNFNSYVNELRLIVEDDTDSLILDKRMFTRFTYISTLRVYAPKTDIAITSLDIRSIQEIYIYSKSISGISGFSRIPITRFIASIES